MRPLFTIHAGEFLVGEFIENYKKKDLHLDVWVPSKDTGTDLLVTGKHSKPPLYLQIKTSRDYKSAEAKNDFQRSILMGGWLVLDHDKIEKSKADLWVVVLVSYERDCKPQFLVIPPKELLKQLIAIHGKSKKYHFYPSVHKSGICIDTRGLISAQQRQLVAGTLVLGDRDLSKYLNNWSALETL